MSIAAGLRVALVVFLMSVGAAPALAGERPMTDKEKQELQRAVAKVVAFVDHDLGLKAKGELALEFTTKEKILEMARKESREEDPESRQSRLRSELLMKKLGLVPPEFSLEQYLQESNPKMILAYYSTETKKLYLLETLIAIQREAVLVHEVVHAIEDEYFSLDTYIRGGSKQEAREAHVNEEKYDAHYDDAASARNAVVEGHAQFAVFRYLYAESHSNRNFVGTGERQEMLRLYNLAFPGLSDDAKAVLKKTPRYVRDSISFPYDGGYWFIRDLYERGRAALAFNQPLRLPPKSTRQVLLPDKYVSDEVIPPLNLPKLAPIAGEDHRLLRIETAGQLDVKLLVEQFDGPDTATRIAQKWRGGVWYGFAGSKTDDAALTRKDVALVYVSRWQDAGTAEAFARVFAKSIAKTYVGAVETREGKRSRWETAEGAMSVEVSGDRVLVLESFDAVTAERLRTALLTPKP